MGSSASYGSCAISPSMPRTQKHKSFNGYEVQGSNFGSAWTMRKKHCRNDRCPMDSCHLWLIWFCKNFYMNLIILFYNIYIYFISFKFTLLPAASSLCLVCHRHCPIRNITHANHLRVKKGLLDQSSLGHPIAVTVGQETAETSSPRNCRYWPWPL